MSDHFVRNRVGQAIRTCGAAARFAVLVVVVVLTACSPSEGGRVGDAVTVTGQSSAAGKRRTLTYYLDTMAVASGDRDLATKKYKDVIKECTSMGVPIVPLRPPDVAKLSLTRTQIWQTLDGTAEQVDHWHPTNAATGMKASSQSMRVIWTKICHFTGVKKDSALTVKLISGKVYTINLSDGKGTVGAVPPPAHPGRLPITPDEEAANEREAGVEGFVKGPTSQVAGQPCQVWTYHGGAAEDYQECFWSEGAKWGYSSSPGGGIKLSTKLLDNGSSVEATTFIVGHLPDHGKIFNAPKNASIRDTTAPSTPEGNQ